MKNKNLNREKYVKEITEALVTLSKMDIRVGQAMVIASIPSEPCPELFYMENEVLYKRLCELLKIEL